LGEIFSDWRVLKCNVKDQGAAINMVMNSRPPSKTEEILKKL
jgi:hypothetical protein